MINIFKKKEKEPESVEDLAKKYKELNTKLKEITSELEELKKQSQSFIQKVGVVRYNPFSGIGSNQSFSIAILDKNDTGIVITSIYSRDGNRVYSKPILNGKSEYEMSKEEKQAILTAKKNYDH